MKRLVHQHYPQPRHWFGVVSSAVVLAAFGAHLGPYGHAHHAASAVQAAKNAPAQSAPAQPQGLGLDAQERAQSAASRQARAVVRMHKDEAYTQKELRQAAQFVERHYRVTAGDKRTFLPAATINQRINAVSLGKDGADPFSFPLLGSELVNGRPSEGFLADGKQTIDMNSLYIDRDSTPEHFVAYLDTLKYRLYEVDAYPDGRVVVGRPYAPRSAQNPLGQVGGHSLPFWKILFTVLLFTSGAQLAIFAIFLVLLALERAGKWRYGRQATSRWRAKVSSPALGPDMPRSGFRVLEPRWSRLETSDGLRILFFCHNLIWDSGDWRDAGPNHSFSSPVKDWWDASDPIEEITTAWVEFCAAGAREQSAGWQRDQERELKEKVAAEQAALEQSERERRLQEGWQVPELLPAADEVVRGLF